MKNKETNPNNPSKDSWHKYFHCEQVGKDIQFCPILVWFSIFLDLLLLIWWEAVKWKKCIIIAFKMDIFITVVSRKLWLIINRLSTKEMNKTKSQKTLNILLRVSLTDWLRIDTLTILYTRKWGVIVWISCFFSSLEKSFIKMKTNPFYHLKIQTNWNPTIEKLKKPKTKNKKQKTSNTICETNCLRKERRRTIPTFLKVFFAPLKS